MDKKKENAVMDGITKIIGELDVQDYKSCKNTVEHLEKFIDSLDTEQLRYLAKVSFINHVKEQIEMQILLSKMLPAIEPMVKDIKNRKRPETAKTLFGLKPEA